MVLTRSQAKQMEDTVEMPQVIEGTQVLSHEDLIGKLVENMEKLERELMNLHEDVEEVREGGMRFKDEVTTLRAELDTVATRFVYTEW